MVNNMNTEIENNETKAFAVSKSAELVGECQSINHTLTIADVRPAFQAHYANAQLDVCGIMALVRDILRNAQAEFPRNAHQTELVNIVIAASMFTSEIIAEVEIRFAAGTTRYKSQSVKNCLSTYGKADGTIAKVKLTSAQDQPRKCSKPRCKWYRVAQQGE